jgi:hypothetical protein
MPRVGDLEALQPDVVARLDATFCNAIFQLAVSECTPVLIYLCPNIHIIYIYIYIYMYTYVCFSLFAVTYAPKCKLKPKYSFSDGHPHDPR